MTSNCSLTWSENSEDNSSQQDKFLTKCVTPGDLPSTKDVLCEHVYAIVQTLTVEHAGRVTGMLADCPTSQLLELLQNPDMLQRRVTQALQVICREAEGEMQLSKEDISAGNKNHSNKEDLGDQLFLKVAQLETELSAQITGMLLELDPSRLHGLLSDDDALEKAVRQARREYLSTHHPQSLPTRDDLGHVLYDLVSHIHPQQAAKITGMILELDTETIHQLVDSPTKLEAKVDTAYQTLMENP